MGQIEVFSGPERRRRGSAEERLQILVEAFSPEACVAKVCRRHDIPTALIHLAAHYPQSAIRYDVGHFAVAKFR